MKTHFACSACNATQSKWYGRCPSCQEFDTMAEVSAAVVSLKKGTAITSNFKGGIKRTADALLVEALDSRDEPPPRASTHISEFDRALGGGLVQGSCVLIGGDPGIGKSTLLMQAAANMSSDRSVHYISGEESLSQIRLRAKRLGVQNAQVGLVSSRDCLAIADLIETLPPGSVVIVDSMQTLDSGIDSTPGSAAQVKAAANHLVPVAKNVGVSLILINQVTKSGEFAGPNILMHAVDATLYLESDSSSGAYRIMRAEKNRFGRVDEIGIFEMTGAGMVSIDNPSEVFISQRDQSAFGTVIFPSIEGSRPLLLEIQALVSPTTFGTGRRSTMGWDNSRLNMLVATMSARLGLSLHDYDIYVNVAGGMRLSDPALDLAVVCALLSALYQHPLPADMVAFGEVGLAGEVRSASRTDARIKESLNLGFSTIYCPVVRGGKAGNISCTGIDRIARLVQKIPQFSSPGSR